MKLRPESFLLLRNKMQPRRECCRWPRPRSSFSSVSDLQVLEVRELVVAESIRPSRERPFPPEINFINLFC